MICMKNVCKMGLRSDVYNPISFGLGMMTDITKIYIIIQLE